MGIFQELDSDNDGKVRIRDLRTRLQDRKLGMPEHIRDDLLRRADINKDGYLEFHEFLHLVRHENNFVSTTSDNYCP